MYHDNLLIIKLVFLEAPDIFRAIISIEKLGDHVAKALKSSLKRQITHIPQIFHETKIFSWLIVNEIMLFANRNH